MQITISAFNTIINVNNTTYSVILSTFSFNCELISLNLVVLLFPFSSMTKSGEVYG
nr:MAG TPA: hypothetical protein [Caudoviricetes sp.]